MDGVGQEVAYAEWPEEQNRPVDGDDSDDSDNSDSSSSPLVARHPAPIGTPRGVTGSPRRNGMVLDANVRTLFGLRSSPQRRWRSPEKYQASPSPSGKKQPITSPRQQHIPPSLSDLSLQSASPKTIWQSPSSTTSTKHGLDSPDDGSPRPKRRLTAEVSGAATSFRYSAPCVQFRFVEDEGEPRRGLLRRSGAPMQSFLPVPRQYAPLSSVGSRPGSATQNAEDITSIASPDPFTDRSGADHASASQDDGPARKRRGYAFWRLTSPPIIESRQAEEAAGTAPLLSKPTGGGDASRRSPGPPESGMGPPPNHQPRQGGTGTNTHDEAGARLSALRALEGIPEERTREEAPDNARVKTLDERNPIAMCGKRLYSDWTGYWDGAPRKIPGAGALFPEGYLPRIRDPEPWICPVRDCQTVFPEVWALGGHFSALHRACLLNDNLDGTMSVVGKRKIPNPISGRMPSVVVSRNAIDEATAPPKATPRRPGRRKKADTVGQGGNPGKPKDGDGGETKQPAVPVASTKRVPSSFHLAQVPTEGNRPGSGRDQQPLTPASQTGSGPLAEEHQSSALWRYLMMYLPHGTRLPDSSHVLELLPLTRRRDLPHRWRFQLAGGHPTVKTLCAVLVYLTGTERPSRCGACAASDNTGAAETTAPVAVLPFPDCITLSMRASTRLKEYFGESACCNKFYQGSDNSKQAPCIVRTPSPSADVKGPRPLTENKPAAAPAQTQDPAGKDKANGPGGDSDSDDDSSKDADGSILLSPATACSSPAYETALPAQVAGKPKVVSIQKPGGPRANTKTKRQSSIRRLAAKLGAKAARREVAVYKPSESLAEGKQAEHTSGARRSRRLLEQQLEHARAESRRSAASRGSGSGGSSPSKASKLKPRSKNGGSSSQGSAVTPSQAGSGQPTEHTPGGGPSMSLAVADWQIAPGRIRVGAGGNAENVAFSSAYLAQGRAVPVADGTTFQTIEMPPGGSMCWPADKVKTCICSVARGLIRVKLPQTEFVIGPNGMWKVNQGVACNVTNSSFLGAVVHVTVIGEDGF